MFKRLRHYSQVFFHINWRWATRYSRKWLAQRRRWWWSRLCGRTYWKLNVDGVIVKLGFSHPYHHQQAKSISEGADERTLLSIWKHQAEAVEPGKIIFDFGGYNGVYGLTAATANPRAKIYIFEPDAVNVAHINKNIELNNLNNVEVVAGVISARIGTVSFETHKGGTGGHITDIGNHNEVRSYTIDEWSARAGSLPQLVKFDIHGAEHEAILAARSTLEKADRFGIILEFYPRGQEADAAFWNFLKELHYRWVYFYPRGDGKSVYYFVFKSQLAEVI